MTISGCTRDLANQMGEGCSPIEPRLSMLIFLNAA